MANQNETKISARILIDFEIDGAKYKCNQVVKFSKSVIESHGSYLDSDKKSVEYCLNELNATVIVHGKEKNSKS